MLYNFPTHFVLAVRNTGHLHRKCDLSNNIKVNIIELPWSLSAVSVIFKLKNLELFLQLSAI